MTPSNGYTSYINNHYEGMDPNTLILMLYRGALKNIRLAKEGVEENNIQKRGENISKVIAIISELNSSLASDMKDESTEFLRGLYSSMLLELPKVSLNNDPSILDLTETYLLRLTEIWETSVMGKTSAQAAPAEPQAQAPPPPPMQRDQGYEAPSPPRPVHGYGGGAGGYGGAPTGRRSFTV